MSDVSTWNPLDSANTAAPPDGWPEFMMPSMVNNSARAMMGAVRRMYDQQISGAIVLPYLKLVGGQTVTGAVTFSAGLTASSITSSGTISAAGNVSTSGSLAAVGNLNCNSIGASGWIGAADFVNAASYQLGAVGFASRGGGQVDVKDGGGTAVLSLVNNGNNYYLNDTHNFKDRGNTVTFASISNASIDLNRTLNVWSGNLLVNSGAAQINGNLTVGGTLTANGDIIGANGVIWCGPTSGEMKLVRDAGASRHYLQFLNGWGLMLETNTGRMLTVAAPGGVGTEIWVMQGFCYANTGAVGGHGAYVDLSDGALKEQIEPATQGLAEILQLQPKTFVRKPRMEGAPQRQELGFVAQEVQQALPLAVVEVDASEGPLLGVTSEAIVAAMVAAIKTIDARLTALEGR